MKKIVIVGGGASGLIAAVFAARNADKGTVVQIVEAGTKAGKKLLTTGNGKCNITNLATSKFSYNNAEFADAVLGQSSVLDVLDFFGQAGLLHHSDSEGRVYPYSNSSATVVNLLLEQCKKLGVEILTNTAAKSIEKTADGFSIVCEKSTIRCDVLVYSVGSMAGLSHPLDNKNLLNRLNIETITPMPALLPIKTIKKEVEGLSGIRTKANVKLLKGTIQIFEERGEVLFREDSLSGIVIFNASLCLCRNFDKTSKYSVQIDLMPDHSRAELIERFHSLRLSIRQYLDGIFHYKITNKLISEGSGTIEDIVDRIKNLQFTALPNTDFKESQISTGGVDTKCINKNTLESLAAKGLFFAGEAIDIDAFSGGFNLQWAWSSGMVAGKNAAIAANLKGSKQCCK